MPYRSHRAHRRYLCLTVALYVAHFVLFDLGLPLGICSDDDFMLAVWQQATIAPSDKHGLPHLPVSGLLLAVVMAALLVSARHTVRNLRLLREHEVVVPRRWRALAVCAVILAASWIAAGVTRWQATAAYLRESRADWALAALQSMARHIGFEILTILALVGLYGGLTLALDRIGAAYRPWPTARLRAA